MTLLAIFVAIAVIYISYKLIYYLVKIAKYGENISTFNFFLHSFSAVVLVVFALVTCFEYHHLGQVSCLENSKQTSKTIEMNCLTRSLYTLDVPLDIVKVLYPRIPHGLEPSRKRKRFVNHYAMTYIHLLVQAFIFIIPAWCWKRLEGGRWEDIKTADNPFEAMNGRLGHLRSYALVSKKSVFFYFIY